MRMEDDPDCKIYLLLQEQLEFWRLRKEDKNLTKEERNHAVEKCIEITLKVIEALENFNSRWKQ